MQAMTNPISPTASAGAADEFVAQVAAQPPTFVSGIDSVFAAIGTQLAAATTTPQFGLPAWSTGACSDSRERWSDEGYWAQTQALRSFSSVTLTSCMAALEAIISAYGESGDGLDTIGDTEARSVTSCRTGIQAVLSGA